MDPQGLTVKVIWFDDDLLELELTAESSLFAGTSQTYCGHGELMDIARSIAAFPSSKDDRRLFSLGGFGPGYAVGAISVELVELERLDQDKSGTAQLQARE